MRVSRFQSTTALLANSEHIIGTGALPCHLCQKRLAGSSTTDRDVINDGNYICEPADTTTFQRITDIIIALEQRSQTWIAD